MGPYDHYATNWGYRVIPNAIPEAEVPTLDQWIMEKSGIYKYGQQSSSLTLLHKQKILEIIQ
jgi:hypothetical protein